jgi:hypothetical protein
MGYILKRQEILAESGVVQSAEGASNIYPSRTADDCMGVHVVKLLQPTTCIATRGPFKKRRHSEKSSKEGEMCVSERRKGTKIINRC